MNIILTSKFQIKCLSLNLKNLFEPRTFYFYILISFITHPHFPLPRGWHASCHELSDSIREAKLKRKKFSPLCTLSCTLGHRQTSTRQELHIAVATHNCGISSKSEVGPPVYTPCIPTQLRHILLSCAILLACLTFKPFF